MTDNASPELRLSDAERDQAAEQLSLAMSEGRLDVPEFELRTRQVYSAVVRSDLNAVLDGLPVQVQPSGQPAPAAASKKPRRRWFINLLGDRRVGGGVDMGDVGTVIQIVGDTNIDLSGVTTGILELQMLSVFGDVTITVPPGTMVESHVFLLLGDQAEDVGRAPVADPLRLRVRGLSLIGDIKIIAKS